MASWYVRMDLPRVPLTAAAPAVRRRAAGLPRGEGRFAFAPVPASGEDRAADRTRVGLERLGEIPGDLAIGGPC
jgi:hypothetical protein